MGEYAERVNSTPNQRKIKNALEQKGHTGVEVWWETLSCSVEMCGVQGGFFAVSDQMPIYPLGTSIGESLETIDDIVSRRYTVRTDAPTDAESEDKQ